MSWFLYLIECRNGSIYTGISTDVAARYAAHASGKGARYTRANPPARLLASVAYADRSAAAQAEYAMKQLTAAEKRAFCAAQATAERATPREDIPAPD
jgi:putative endonuclease